MKTIAMVGSRRRNSNRDYSITLKTFFQVYKPGDTLVSGGCPEGGDDFLRRIALGMGLEFVELPEGERPRVGVMNIHPALWKKYGRRAGFVRNTFIARDADTLIAVVAADRTGGTEDTIDKFITLGKSERLIIL